VSRVTRLKKIRRDCASKTSSRKTAALVAALRSLNMDGSDPITPPTPLHRAGMPR
jgi:hypothetical protein